MTDWKTQARAEYEADCKKRPFYHDGTKRRAFDDLAELYQRTWAPKQEEAPACSP